MRLKNYFPASQVRLTEKAALERERMRLGNAAGITWQQIQVINYHVGRKYLVRRKNDNRDFPAITCKDIFCDVRL
jgi:hypothetical protein